MIELGGLAGGIILDAGCGDGALARHLIERGVPFEQYVGIDALEPMIAEAGRHDLGPRQKDVRFIADDLLARPEIMAGHRPDFVCISGTLNTMDESAARRLVKAAFDASAQAVLFNFLSDRCHPRWVGRDLYPARRFDTMAWLDWALGLTSRVTFSQSYMDGHDATVVMAKEGTEARRHVGT
jgi:SAM-dependent methyltransferase